MKIVIINGGHEADYIVKHFKNHRNKLIIINDDNHICEYISANNNLPVLYGDATKRYTLEDAKIQNADLLITLTANDSDNYVISKYAKDIFNVRKVICLVSNPKKVAIFKKLGIDIVISSIHLLAESIKEETALESVIKTLTIRPETVVLIDLIVEENMVIANKLVKDANLPINMNIGCILRNETEVIIPYGQTILLPKDHLYIFAEPSEQENILEQITKKVSHEKK